MNVGNLLLLQNASLISTEAGSGQFGGNGGSITINAPFLVAVPEENSDIIANAFAGTGGNVTITSQDIVGIDARPALTPFSDITASSQIGIDGTVVINTPATDPSRGLAELPSNLVDGAQLFAQTCPSDRRSVEALGEFTVTGRGGLPPNPYGLQSDNQASTHWISIPELREPELHENDSGSVSPLGEALMSPPIEAQGWYRDTNGTVFLVASDHSPSGAPALSTQRCPS